MKDQIETLAALLRSRGWKITTAESCTGGGLAYALTELSGSSDWFERGFVTYSNEAKREMLGVKELTLAQHGAVSEAVVCEMALGALQHSRAQVSVAISGVAGPTGGSPEKPVGTVWIAWGMRDQQVSARVFLFEGGRDSVRIEAMKMAIDELIKRLKNNHLA